MPPTKSLGDYNLATMEEKAQKQIKYSSDGQAMKVKPLGICAAKTSIYLSRRAPPVVEMSFKVFREEF